MKTDYFSKIRILDGGMGQELLSKGLKALGSLCSATALLDEKYQRPYGYSQDGRNFRIGLRTKF